MSFLETMQSYFKGERLEALFFIGPAGLVLFVLAAAAFKAEKGGFAWGLAVPFIIFGLVLAGVGAGVGFRTPSQVEALEKQYAESPKLMVQKELPRMEQVNRMWPIYVGVWATLVVFGLLLRFALSADWAHGVGPALILVGAFGFLIDGFAERRARPYTAALEALAAEHGLPKTRGHSPDDVHKPR
jgi:hypothetical protein